MGPVQFCHGMDHVTFVQQGTTHHITGQVLVEAQDGGLLFKGQNQHIWTIMPDEIKERSSDAESFNSYTKSELVRNLQATLPSGFDTHRTRHYLIFHNTSREYARWCGGLYERLYRAFFNFWRREGLKLEEPDVLVALIFRDQSSYIAYAKPELGDAVTSIIGYYSLATNHITTFDLTGIDKVRRNNDRRGSIKHIRQILSRPEAERTVATVIHEATHQLAFNSGLQKRFADNPLWLSEGLAIYFESPDLSSQRGWRGIGELHPLRLRRLQSSLASRPSDSLFTMLTNDLRFRDTRQAEIAYAEAWALCYHLLRTQSDEFVDYMKTIGSKGYLSEDSPETRIRDFQGAFHENWQEIDAKFLRAIPSWR